MKTILFIIAAAECAATATAQDVENGKRLFLRDGCYQCHGMVGQGGLNGPRLAQTKLPQAAFMAILRNPPPSAMPPFRAKTVPDKEVADLYAFIKSIPAPAPVKDIPLLNSN